MEKEKRWFENPINLGILKEGKKVKFNFESVGELNIEKVKAGCGGCTTLGKYSKKTRKLPVIFKAPNIPVHLNSSQLNTKKTITVWYKGGEKEVLTFLAVII